MNIKNIWDSFLNNIKNQVTSLAFDTWFKETELVELNANKAIVKVQSQANINHLYEHYIDIIEATFNDITGTNFEIEFILTQNSIKNEIEKNENIYNKIEDSNLNNKYNFDNFVVGNSNKFAQAAALAVAQNPGKIYNPLFLYGKSGLGKTHLMQAIGNYVINNSKKTVLYTTSEKFISDFVGLSKKSYNGNSLDYIDYFKNKYRNVDVLIVDDIQFLAGCTETQKEFFHTFNNLYDGNKQIIISSDRSPDDLKLLEERLRTRFNWGLTVNIYPPDFELRIEILKKKVSIQGLIKEISNDVIEYIANNCESDIRQLEGAITRLYAYAAMMSGSDITLDLAMEALKDYLNKGMSIKNNIQKIQRIVAEYYNVSVDDLKSKRRLNSITLPRQIAMYLSRILTDESYPRIGLEFGGKDHSTVIHSFEKIKKELKGNNQLKEVIEVLKRKLN
ncbi:MAG: chromosomal replication initiator protein DnaA [Bacilli bacterium]